MELREYQKEAVQAVMNWVKKCTNSCVVEAPTGCHRIGTKVIMVDGTIKAVEDVAVGDRLLNPYGEPNTVQALCRGVDTMYQITPTKGVPWYCNGGHILHIKSKDTGAVGDMPLSDWLYLHPRAGTFWGLARMGEKEAIHFTAHKVSDAEDYYGFRLDGNHLYCLEDFTITHNSGKSLLVSAIAKQIHAISGKKILCLAPSGELIDQNYAKYRALGEPASIYSASLGKKCLRSAVVFGSPLTIVNSLAKFGSQFAAIIIDEAHGITPTVRKIIEHIKAANPNLRVIGLSATPYRLGEGYIYRYGPEGEMPAETITEPYFDTLVYTIEASELIEQGYLTPPAIGTVSDQYDTSGLKKTSMGTWDAESVDRAFVGKGRLTSRIVEDVVEKAKGRGGVMFFAATVAHAHEIAESLPESLTRVVVGTLDKKTRAQYIDDFTSQRAKYIVNVAVLTTGFDAPHVDTIAILRATESSALMMQIVGRGLRLYPGKAECLVLDYAGNIGRHFPGGDLFKPEIKGKAKGDGEGIVLAQCPSCGMTNEFSRHKDAVGMEYDAQGYALDEMGNRIDTAYGPMPAHYGRRCHGRVKVPGSYELERCSYRWTFKACESCGHENDIAARFCAKCRAELVDPNAKLTAEGPAKDPNDPVEVEFRSWTAERWPGRDGKPDTLCVTYFIDKSPYKIREWYGVESNTFWPKARWSQFAEAVWGGVPPDIDAALDMWPDAVAPVRLKFKLKKDSKFYEIVSKTWEKANESRSSF